MTGASEDVRTGGPRSGAEGRPPWLTRWADNHRLRVSGSGTSRADGGSARTALDQERLV